MNNNNNNEIVFWKVFKNRFLVKLIFHYIHIIEWIDYDDYMQIDVNNRIKFKDINSLKWMLDHKLYQLARLKLKHDDEHVEINENSIITLFKLLKEESENMILNEILILLLSTPCRRVDFQICNLVEVVVKQLDLKTLKLLLNQPYSMKVYPSTIETAIHTNNIEITKELLNHYTDIIPNELKKSIFKTATKWGNSDCTTSVTEMIKFIFSNPKLCPRLQTSTSEVPLKRLKTTSNDNISGSNSSIRQDEAEDYEFDQIEFEDFNRIKCIETKLKLMDYDLVSENYKKSLKVEFTIEDSFEQLYIQLRIYFKYCNNNGFYKDIPKSIQSKIEDIKIKYKDSEYLKLKEFQRYILLLKLQTQESSYFYLRWIIKYSDSIDELHNDGYYSSDCEEDDGSKFLALFRFINNKKFGNDKQFTQAMSMIKNGELKWLPIFDYIKFNKNANKEDLRGNTYPMSISIYDKSIYDWLTKCEYVYSFATTNKLKLKTLEVLKHVIQSNCKAVLPLESIKKSFFKAITKCDIELLKILLDSRPCIICSENFKLPNSISEIKKLVNYLNDSNYSIFSINSINKFIELVVKSVSSLSSTSTAAAYVKLINLHSFFDKLLFDSLTISKDFNLFEVIIKSLDSNSNHDNEVFASSSYKTKYRLNQSTHKIFDDSLRVETSNSNSGKLIEIIQYIIDNFYNKESENNTIRNEELEIKIIIPLKFDGDQYTDIQSNYYDSSVYFPTYLPHSPTSPGGYSPTSPGGYSPTSPGSYSGNSSTGSIDILENLNSKNSIDPCIINFIYNKLLQCKDLTIEKLLKVHKLIQDNSIIINHTIFHSFYYLFIRSKKFTKYILSRPGITTYLRNLGLKHYSGLNSFTIHGYDLKRYLDVNVFTFDYVFGGINRDGVYQFNKSSDSILNELISHLSHNIPNDSQIIFNNFKVKSIDNNLKYYLTTNRIDLFFKEIDLLKKNIKLPIAFNLNDHDVFPNIVNTCDSPSTLVSPNSLLSLNSGGPCIAIGCENEICGDDNYPISKTTSTFLFPKPVLKIVCEIMDIESIQKFIEYNYHSMYILDELFINSIDLKRFDITMFLLENYNIQSVYYLELFNYDYQTLQFILDNLASKQLKQLARVSYYKDIISTFNLIVENHLSYDKIIYHIAINQDHFIQFTTIPIELNKIEEVLHSFICNSFSELNSNFKKSVKIQINSDDDEDTIVRGNIDKLKVIMRKKEIQSVIRNSIFKCYQSLLKDISESTTDYLCEIDIDYKNSCYNLFTEFFLNGEIKKCELVLSNYPNQFIITPFAIKEAIQRNNIHIIKYYYHNNNPNLIYNLKNDINLLNYLKSQLLNHKDYKFDNWLL